MAEEKREGMAEGEKREDGAREAAKSAGAVANRAAGAAETLDSAGRTAALDPYFEFDLEEPDFSDDGEGRNATADGTVVMNPAAVKRALARAALDAELAEVQEAGDTVRWKPQGKGRNETPHAVVTLAGDGASPVDNPQAAEREAELIERAAPDVTTFLRADAIAAAKRNAAYPVAGATMVMPKASAKPADAEDEKRGGAHADDSAARTMLIGRQPAPGFSGAASEAVRTSSGLQGESEEESFGWSLHGSLGSEGSLASVQAAPSAVSADADVPTASALFLSAFFDELYRMGMRDVVVSPGSRSTPLAMVAYEMSRRPEYDVRLFVDVDERGAAFFALGLGKATGRPACAICTSGTAGANYYPAVLEAESSRVPLLLFTGDRPPRLQSLGAPQTCNQEKLFGDHVRLFMQMPLPSADASSLAFARQAARESFARTVGPAGPCAGGPVHLNFPFEEPLKPNLAHPELFALGRSPWCGAPEDAGISSIGPCVRAGGRLSDEASASIEALLAEHTVAIMAGEGSVETEDDVRALMELARQRSIPVLADPLSNLRKVADDLVIDRYDNILASEDCPDFSLVVRFGRYPVSKRATAYVQRRRPVQIVVDQLESRDFNAGTDLFVRMAPADFARSLNEAAQRAGGQALKEHGQERFAEAWMRRNAEENARVDAVGSVESGFEGAFVRALLDTLPEGSLLFSANSMSVRAVDSFCGTGARFDILCNRGLNGIDGTLSTALGAAQAYRQTVLLTGDLALLHDLPAFALNAELMRVHRERGDLAPSVMVVLLNNHGGGIFDMLPQKSEDDYFERLFLTPEHADFGQVAAAFDVPYARVVNVADFKTAFAAFSGRPGVSLLEVEVPLEGLKERYAPYQ